jgi:hypothetical protein
MFEHTQKDFRAGKEEILHVAQSLIHDHVPAKKAGLRPGVWIERGGVDMDVDSENRSGKGVDVLEKRGEVALGARFKTLGEMAVAIEQAFIVR